MFDNFVLCIVGPTAVGKTDFSIKLAQEINAEIINADSMQIYKYMDIGTAKPTTEERNKVTHHLIDIVEPDMEFNVKLFLETATDKIKDIKSTKKNVIIAGGTGLYIKALLYGIFDAPSGDDSIRKRLTKEINEYGIDRVYNKLKMIDPKSYERIHKNDQKRIIRALEVYELTGNTITQLQEEQKSSHKSPFQFKIIGLTDKREYVYSRIENRCDKMMGLGFIDEVKSLREMGYQKDLQSMQAIGYSHINRYIDNDYDYNEMLTLFKRDTRRFAKRQWTLFNSLDNVEWITYKPTDDIYIHTEKIKEFMS